MKFAIATIVAFVLLMTVFGMYCIARDMFRFMRDRRVK